MKNNAALFLDRDGTINIDLMTEYLSDPARVQLITGAGLAIVKAQSAGFKISIITNQAGVAKGLTPPSALTLVHQRIEELIAAEAQISTFKFDDIQVCPHHPNDGCLCRKPGTLSLQNSLEKLNANPHKSFFIGDKESDLLCAHRMSINAILVLTGHGQATAHKLNQYPELKPLAIVPSLLEAVDFILSKP